MEELVQHPGKHGEDFKLQPPSEAEVKAVIMVLKNTGTEGIDKIPVQVLKLGAPILSSTRCPHHRRVHQDVNGPGRD